MPTKPLIDLEAIVASRKGSGWVQPIVPFLNRFLKLDEINKIHADITNAWNRGEVAESNFFLAALRLLGVNYEISEKDLHKIPPTGPLMVVANHPFGGIDGLILGAVLMQARPDVRLLANELLGSIEPIRPYLFGVNVFGGNSAVKNNLKSMKQGVQWLKSGGCVATFPSGTVSHFSGKSMVVVDPAWNQHIVRLSRKSDAGILPMHFSGNNSWLFQLSGLIHPMLQTLLLTREFVRMRGKTVEVRIGKPVTAGRMSKFDSEAEATQFVRLQSYVLKERSKKMETLAIRKFPLLLSRKTPVYEPIVDAVDASILKKEVAALGEEALLMSHGVFDVYLAKAEEIPLTLREIGRLREKTFRVIGEGTGSSIDLDEFDPHYLHMFLWNRKESEVVGAYRLGLTDVIRDQFGKRGLYTTTLFKLKDEFLEELSPAIELGRSFIRIEYQRKQATLSILWKGIGSFIARHPQYSRLFGPVSITAEYSSISKDLMVQFLRENRFHPTFSKMVRPRNPLRVTTRLRTLFYESMKGASHSMDDISAMISEIEFDQKGIPILLKHYLRLNGVMLSFNRDPKFSDVVDGLILVDLKEADPHTLKRYIGFEGTEKFKEYQAAKLLEV